MLRLTPCLVAVLLLLVTPATSCALLIDSFDGPSGPPSFPPPGQNVADPTNPFSPTSASSVGGLTGIAVGGDRDVIVDRQSGSGTTTVSISSTGFPYPSDNILSYIEDSGTDGRFEVAWDGDGDGAPLGFVSDAPGSPGLAGLDAGTGLGGINIISGGYVLLEIRYSHSIGAGIPFDFIVYSSASDFSTFSGTLPSASSVFTLSLLTPTSTGGLGADLTSVTAMVFAHDDAGALRPFTIDNIQTMPEPSSLALLGMGTLSLLGYRLRRRKRQSSQELQV